VWKISLVTSSNGDTMVRGFTSRRLVNGLIVGAAAITVVSLVVDVLQRFVDPIGLTSLYLFAIFPVAIGWGFLAAGIVTVASFLTFAFFFGEPLHSFQIADRETAASLTIALASAYVVSELARRAHERALEAQTRADEAEAMQGELQILAAEQSALRRVATLVAQGEPTVKVLEAVTREVGLRCDAGLARMERFEPDGTITAIAAWSRSDDVQLAVGTRFVLEGASIAGQVRETGEPARVDSFEGASGPIAREAQALGILSSVGCPIVVAGRTWGVIAASTLGAPFPADTEARIADFTELAATAIANAESQAQLRASRARIANTADETRRRIERDLHDGAQQQLVSLALQARGTQAAIPAELGDLDVKLEQIARGITDVLEELRELARGIHPAVLAEGGLDPALKTLARRSAVPVVLSVRVEGRMPEPVEVAAYYVVSETLTNTAKHANASSVSVDVEIDDGILRVGVGDDGIGGAAFERGSGLVGLKDRVEALGGRFAVESEPEAGTAVHVELPTSDEP
jgi:signal transduction histidine kinase